MSKAQTWCKAGRFSRQISLAQSKQITIIQAWARISKQAIRWHRSTAAVNIPDKQQRLLSQTAEQTQSMMSGTKDYHHMDKMIHEHRGRSKQQVRVINAGKSKRQASRQYSINASAEEDKSTSVGGTEQHSIKCITAAAEQAHKQFNQWKHRSSISKQRFKERSEQRRMPCKMHGDGSKAEK